MVGGNHAGLYQPLDADLTSIVRGVVLTGLSVATNAAIISADTILVAFGKLQKQITDLSTTVNLYKTEINRNQSSNQVTTLTDLPIDKRLVYASVSAATTLSLSGSIGAGSELHIVVRNNSASTITQTIPNDGGTFISVSGNSISIPAGGYVEINILKYAAGYPYSIRAI